MYGPETATVQEKKDKKQQTHCVAKLMCIIQYNIFKQKKRRKRDKKLTKQTQKVEAHQVCLPANGDGPDVMNNNLHVPSDLCTQWHQDSARIGTETLDLVHGVVGRGREHSLPVLKYLHKRLAPCPIGQQ